MYKKMCINMLVLVCCLFSSASYSIVVVDVLKIVGKTPLQVADILGTPSGCFITKYGRKCSYILADTEVVFINDKADWITVEGIDNIPFNNDVLKSLGLIPKAPIFKNGFTLRWTYIQGLKEITVFKGPENSDYAYIKALTK